MKNLPWSALAMCFDCEGTISLGKHNKTKEGNVVSIQLDLTIVNTDERLIKWLVSNFGGRYYLRNRYCDRWKPSFRWRVTGKANKEKILLGILPYLICKKNQALLALDFIRMPAHERKPEKRLSLMIACQKLNAKGPALTTNTHDNPQTGLKIESEHYGDIVSAPLVTEGGDKIPDDNIIA